MTTRIHSTAMVEEGVILGEGTSVWDHVHIRHGSVLGDECIVGGKAYIAYDVKIGNRCKINSNVYICNGVTIEDGVMIAAGTIFTNDRFPRAATSDLTALRPSDPDESTERTLVRCGATIGAGCVVGSNLTIGRWAMIGMGAIVTSDVPDFHLSLGSPARSIGAVCRCGTPLVRFSDTIELEQTHACGSCQRRYQRSGQAIRELD
ncbi:MAG: acyltransferase [Pirellula sp.]|jgi:UDP-2-acetamido-3-amino-2,3-dideoxy-glucuronate N-acetyltransferase